MISPSHCVNSKLTMPTGDRPKSPFNYLSKSSAGGLCDVTTAADFCGVSSDTTRGVNPEQMRDVASYFAAPPSENYARVARLRTGLPGTRNKRFLPFYYGN